ncbi:uncharacterized protein LOC135477885 [Liolophura sinensis]|uniref:uncharacterized protein LOC135477885 n=1 Tax=Liolophura sinensis TaxID=3198878 RepID=UPI0031598BB4
MESKTEEEHFEVRSVEEEKELRDKYDSLTKETEGRICRKDVINMWRQMITCPAVDYINSTFEKMNINENVPLSFDDFRNIWLKSLAAHSAACRNVRSEILAEFNRFDANKDGFIDTSELKQMVECQGETISDEDLEEFFKMADTNCDGKISFEEYAEVFLSDKL